MYILQQPLLCGHGHINHPLNYYNFYSLMKYEYARSLCLFDTGRMAKIALKMSIMKVGKFMSSPGNGFMS